MYVPPVANSCSPDCPTKRAAQGQGNRVNEFFSPLQGEMAPKGGQMEGGKGRPSTTTLAKVAAATGTRLRVSFEAVA